MSQSTVYTEQHKPSDWLKGETEDPKDFSRDTITLLSGQNLISGTVLAKLTSGGKAVEFDAGASAGAGSDTAIGILYVDTDATDGDVLCTYISRDAVIDADGLTWAANISGGQKTTALATLKGLGIIARTGA